MPEPGLATVTANSTIAVLFSKLIVLFVRVCVSSKSTNVASDTAVFNCASVEVTVLLAKFIDLFVSVSVELSVTTVESIAILISLPLAVVSIPVPPAISNVSESKSIDIGPPLSAVTSKSSAVICAST